MKFATPNALRHSSSSRRRQIYKHVNPAPASPDALLRQRLILLKKNFAGVPDFHLDLPEPEAARVRTLVHRGTQRPVFKIASLKLGRVVQCESMLEMELALRLDVSPRVTAFAEQPIRIHYMLDGEWRSHVPDYTVLSDERITVIEVKFKKDVDAEVNERTVLMKAAFDAMGARYRLLTEEDVREGYAVQNALCILRRARHDADEARVVATLETLRAKGEMALSAFGWSTPESESATRIAQLMIRGRAAVNMYLPLSDASPVRFVHRAQAHQEGASW